jgi:hypothetical protein
VLAKLKEGMLSKCDSQIARQALEAGTTPSVKEGIEDVNKSIQIDANVLELLGQCLPDSCISAIVERAYKNELITQLFPFGVRDKLSRIVRNGGRTSINHLVMINERVRDNDDIPSRASSFDRAEQLRARFYELNGVSIVNHTLPDYNTCLSRQATTDAASVVVKMLAPRSSCPTESTDYHNFYDGINPFRVAPRKKTESAYSFTSESFKTMSPIEKCIQKAAVVSAHISSKGGNGKIFWDLILAVWGCKEEMSRPVVTMNIKEGSSYKRISPTLTSQVHPIACFPNVQHCAMIDSTNLGNYLSAYSTNTDYMSFVTAARCFGLLEYACSNIRTEEIPFAILPGNLPPTDNTSLSVIDEESLHKGMDTIRKNSSSIFQDSIRASLVTKELAVDDDEFIQAVEYSVGTHKETRVVGTIHLKPGFMRQEITGGLGIQVPSGFKGPVVEVLGEELRHEHGSNLNTMFRELCSKVGPSQALANAMIHVVSQQFKREAPKRFIIGSWKEMGNIMKEEFPNWPETWKNVTNAAKHCKSVLSDEVVDSLFRYFDSNVKQTFKFMNPKPNEHSATVLGVLYMVSHGRLPTPECYTLTSALGTVYIAKCWRMASMRRKYNTRGNEINNSLISRIYSGLATQAAAYNPLSGTKQTVILGAHQAILSFLEELQENSIAALNDFNAHFLTVENIRKTYYFNLSKVLNSVGGRNRFDLNSFTYEMENIVKDVLSLGEIRLLGDLEEVCAPAVDPTVKPISVYDPTVFSDLEVIDIPIEGSDKGIRERKIVSASDKGIRERKIVSAYLKRGAYGISIFLKGELEVEPCSDSDLELYEEAIETYEDWIAEFNNDDQPDNSQFPDEAT